MVNVHKKNAKAYLFTDDTDTNQKYTDSNVIDMLYIYYCYTNVSEIGNCTTKRSLELV